MLTIPSTALKVTRSTVDNCRRHKRTICRPGSRNRKTVATTNRGKAVHEELEIHLVAVELGAVHASKERLAAHGYAGARISGPEHVRHQADDRRGIEAARQATADRNIGTQMDSNRVREKLAKSFRRFALRRQLIKKSRAIEFLDGGNFRGVAMRFQIAPFAQAERFQCNRWVTLYLRITILSHSRTSV